MNDIDSMTEAEAILVALHEVDNFVVLPRAILLALPIREAVVLCWLRFRSGGTWIATTHADLGHGIGLSADQTHRAMQRLEQIGVIESRTPDRMSRRREYRIRGIDTAEVRHGTAESRRPDTAESRRLPIEGSEVLREEVPMTADAAAQAFDVFWEHHPKSRRRERANCLAIFRKEVKKRPEAVQEIVAGHVRWLRYWQDAKTEERFITTSIVWLRNRRWEDDPTLSKPAGGRPDRRSALAQGATDRTGESGVW